MKTGRNEPCPCGSGKKYKKCHLNTPMETMQSVEEEEEDTSDVFARYRKTDKLNQFGALQLVSQNHGKNLRIEDLIFNSFKSIDISDEILTYQNLTDIFNNHYSYDYREDPTDNFFTENVIFFGGNYIVYPGIAENGTQILNNFLEGIFTVDNNLPHEFKLKVHNATRFLLEISTTIANRSGHVRFLTENSDGDNENITVPIEKVFDKLKAAIWFTNKDINNMSKAIDVPISTLNDFLCDEKELPDEYDCNDLFLVEKPLYNDGTDYLVIFPTGIIIAITNYIKSLAIEYNCVTELHNCYYKWQWKKIVDYCYEMSWKLTSIQLPPTDIGVKEGIFQIDNDKLAYVCLIKAGLQVSDEDNDGLEDGNEFVSHEKKNNKYAAREKEVLEYLKGLSKSKYRYFTLNILGSLGEMFFFSWNKPETGNQTLTFGFSDFQKVIFAGDLDELSLWKFSKAYLVANETTTFSPLTGMLNTYVAYKQNEGSMLPSDAAAPNFMIIDLGMATEFGRNAIINRDEHAAPLWHNDVIAHLPVKKHSKYAPIYTERELSLKVNLLVESYSCPIWVTNSQAKKIGDKNAINDFVEAIAFWLFKLTQQINGQINQLGDEPIEIKIEIDSAFINGIQTFEFQEIKETDISIGISLQGRIIKVSIPQNISQLLIVEHNAGERLIMKRILNGLNQLLDNRGLLAINDVELNNSIDAAIPFGRAKMILFVDAAKDPRLRDFKLLSTRYIQDTETSFILDNLVKNLNLSTPIPVELTTPKEKTALCREVVSSLIAQIEAKLKAFDAEELLKWLITYNERYVHNREFREILIPARIACFSDFPTEVAELTKKEGKLVGSSLAIRCLIEFVAAVPHFGNTEVNLDDLDVLLALMHEVCQWGVISDTIHFGMSDPQMGLLPSGRIGFSREFSNDFIKPFQDARAENEVYDLVASFDDKIRIKPEKEAVTYTGDVKEVDDAFASEYGINLTQVMHILRELMNISLLKEESVMIMDEQSLIKMVAANTKDLKETDIIMGLQILSLDKRESITKAPVGFEMEDIFPWRYNRALSYIRRPIVKMELPDGTINYYWGFRHVMAAGENLRALVMSGRLRTKQGTLLDSFIAKMNNEKGDAYRNSVCEFLKGKTLLRIIDYEVKISPSGHLQADIDYGDIDIMAIDEASKIIYSIECKNTVSARVAHEMKTEMDKYLGREAASGMIQKHVERDEWLQANKEKVLAFIQTNEEYTIKSLVLTSEEIPLIYLAKEKLPIPVLSFKSLRRKGAIMLDELK